MALSQLHRTDWRGVPGRVVDLLPTALTVLLAHEQAAEKIGALATSAVTWAPETDAVTLHTSKPLTKEAYDIYWSAVHNDSGVVATKLRFKLAANQADSASAIGVKRGSQFPNVGPWEAANRMLGGPTPLSNGIVTGLLAGGLGYGAGALAEQLFPERYVARGKLRRTLGAVGALTGVGLGLNNAYVNGRATGTNTLRGLFTSNSATPISEYVKESFDSFNQPRLHTPFINVPQFNNAVWSDVGRGAANGFQTHTPPQYGAAMTGMMSGLSAQHQSPIISPMTVIRGIASAGVGLATANIAGRALSALGGLTPAGQNKLQDMGLWGGMMHAIVPTLFGR